MGGWQGHEAEDSSSGERKIVPVPSCPCRPLTHSAPQPFHLYWVKTTLLYWKWRSNTIMSEKHTVQYLSYESLIMLSYCIIAKRSNDNPGMCLYNSLKSLEMSLDVVLSISKFTPVTPQYQRANHQPTFPGQRTESNWKFLFPRYGPWLLTDPVWV